MMNDPKDPFVLTRAKIFIYGGVLTAFLCLLVWFYVPKAPPNLAKHATFTEGTGYGVPAQGDLPPGGMQQTTGNVASQPVSSATAQDQDQGLELYRRFCEQCHGADGKANTPMARMMSVKVPNLAQGPFNYSRSPEEIAKLVRMGSANKAMPGFAKELTDKMALDIANYALSLEVKAENP